MWMYVYSYQDIGKQQKTEEFISNVTSLSPSQYLQSKLVALSLVIV